MKKVVTANLALSEELPTTICHESGTVLHRPGQKLTRLHVELMEQSGIETVCELTDSNDLFRFQQEAIFRRIRTADLHEGMVLSTPIYGPQRRLLVQAGVKLTSSLREGLLRQGAGEALIRKTVEELRLSEVETYRKLLEQYSDVLEGGGLGGIEERSAPGAQEEGYPAKERRSHTRYEANTPVIFYVRRSGATEWETTPTAGSVRDLSGGGIRLLTSRRLVVGQRIRLSIRPGNRTVAIDGLAEIVRTRRYEDRYEAGARFLFVQARRHVPSPH